MSKYSPSPVGLSSVAPLIARIISAALTRAITYPFRTVRCTRLYNDVLYAAVRRMLDHMTIAQSRYLNASTTTRYIAFCKSQKIEPVSLEVPFKDRTISAHWLGSPDAENVILYLHGGGYTQSANLGNFKYMSRLVDDLNAQAGSKKVAVLMLAYTLVPEALYPTQLQETAAVLAHLLHNLGRSPSNIFISGDSAGGNLALSLFSHLLHPHPDVQPVKLSKPLAGMLLYSPWAAFSTQYPSYKNVELDMLSPVSLRRWSAMFLDKSDTRDTEADPGEISGDAWTEAALNKAEWWRAASEVVQRVFISYGSHEVLADPIRELEGNLEEGWKLGGGDVSQVVFVEGSQEAHISPIVDVMTPRGKGKSSTQVAIEAWYKACLQI